MSMPANRTWLPVWHQYATRRKESFFVNWVKDMKIEQEFTRLDNGEWVLSKDDTSRIRTYDLLITRELHYHCTIEAFGSLMGIEPTTTRATTWHSTN